MWPCSIGAVALACEPGAPRAVRTAERGASAERTIDVDTGAAPFVASELVAALRMRIAVRGPAVIARVIAVDGSRVTIAFDGREATVELGDRRGPDAARLVALAVVDAVDAIDAIDAADGATAAPGEVAARAVAAAPARGEPWTVAVGAFGGVRAWSSVLAGGGAELVVSHAGYAGALEIAGDRRVTGDLALGAVAVRASGGVHSGAFELRAGLVVVPTTESDGAGDRATLVGASASVRVHAAVAARVHLIAFAGLDIYGTQTTYVDGNRAIVTPWIAPWLGFGTEVAL